MSHSGVDLAIIDCADYQETVIQIIHRIMAIYVSNFAFLRQFFQFFGQLRTYDPNIRSALASAWVIQFKTAVNHCSGP